MSGNKLDGYSLTLKLRKARRRHPLTASEQALYYELIAICNDDDWPDTFNCSNDELCASLCISENTLNASRNRLIQVGLVSYRSGKSKRQFGTYSFSVKLTTSKFDTNTGANTATNTGVDTEGDTGVDTATNPADYYKLKEKRKLKPNNSEDKSSGASSSSPEKNKKKSSGAAKIDSTPHWGSMVKLWFEFYEENFKIKPTFKGPAPAALKSILQRLEELSKLHQQQWTEEYAQKVFKHFLLKAIADKWRKENFLLHILSSHFDSIIQKNENATATKGKRNDYSDLEREMAAELGFDPGSGR